MSIISSSLRRRENCSSACTLNDHCGFNGNGKGFSSIGYHLNQIFVINRSRGLIPSSRRLNLRTGPSSPSAASRTRCKSATWVAASSPSPVRRGLIRRHVREIVVEYRLGARDEVVFQNREIRLRTR